MLFRRFVGVADECLYIEREREREKAKTKINKCGRTIRAACRKPSRIALSDLQTFAPNSDDRRVCAKRDTLHFGREWGEKTK